jgi:hypothetical protein
MQVIVLDSSQEPEEGTNERTASGSISAEIEAVVNVRVFKFRSSSSRS